MHSAQVTLTNTGDNLPPKGSEVKAFCLLTWSMIIPGILDNKDHLQLKDMKSGILPPDHEYPAVHVHCTHSDRKAAACLVFLEADVNFSAES